MSEERHPKEIAELLRFRCAISAMDPRDRELLIGAADALDAYADLLARHNALRDAVKKMLHIDTPENFEGGSYLKARAEMDRLLSEDSNDGNS